MILHCLTKDKQTKADKNYQSKKFPICWSIWLLLPFSVGLFSFQQQALSKSFSELKSSSFRSEISPCKKVTCGVYNGVRLDWVAKSITVKVLSGNTWGSGILLQRQGQVYTVVTNRHVLNLGDYPYIVQTPDGQVYQANFPSKNMRFGGNDLALLQFSSRGKVYAVASLRSSHTLSEGDRVFAAGFPFDGRGFVLTKGRVLLLPDQALEQGYKIGYTNDIQKGMSGGPLLNRQGEVVGINGMHAYPLWGDPYVYRDGSLPSAEVRDRMIALAFAIPIDTFAQLAPQFASLPDSLQTPNMVENRGALSLFMDFFSLKPSPRVVHPKPINLDSVFVE